MKNLKRFLSIALLLSVVFGILSVFGACTDRGEALESNTDTSLEGLFESDSSFESGSETETETETDAPPVSGTTLYNLKLCKKDINIIGRCPVTDYGIESSWSASGIEFKVKCDGDIQLGAVSYTKNGEYRVFVDGVEHGKVTIPTSAAKYPLGLNLSKDEWHTVALYRITNNESNLKVAKTMFVSLIFDGELGDTTSDRNLVEFIGDSITCGSGLHESGSGFDGTLAYCFTLAQSLGWDHSMVATSGMGVYMGTTRHQNKGSNMAKEYEYVNYLNGSNEIYKPMRKANLVIINLNTNDNDHGGNDNETEYKAAVNTLIEKIRAAHGENVNIVWVIGMMRPAKCNLNDWVKEVFASLGGESQGLYTVTVTQDNNGKGDHPSLSANNIVAEEIKTFLTDKGLV